MRSSQKIKKEKELKKIIQILKRKKKKIIFTNGCFDLLHYGHIRYLEEAKKYGDILIVAINSDNSVRRLKGKNRPINNQRDRARILASLNCVDYITIFDTLTPLKLIKNLRPDFLVKGGDWRKEDIVGKDIVLSYGGEVKTLAFLKNYSTTGLIRKIVKRFG